MLAVAIMMTVSVVGGVTPAAADDAATVVVHESTSASAVSPSGFSVDVVCVLVGVVTPKGITADVTVVASAPGAVVTNAQCVVQNTGDRVSAAFPGQVAAGTAVVHMPDEQPRLCAQADVWFIDGSRAYSGPC